MMINKAILLLAIGCLTASVATAQMKKTDNKQKFPTVKNQQTVQQVGEAQMKLSAPNPDQDGDGHSAYSHGGDDCDDTDALRYPGNVEVADADNRDEDCNAETYGFLDNDDDGFMSAQACNERADGSMNCGPDCDDQNSSVHPLQIDILNGRDDNCNLAIDEDQTAAQLRALLGQ